MLFVHPYIITTYNNQESSLHGMEDNRKTYRFTYCYDLWQKLFPMNNEKENSEIFGSFSLQRVCVFEVRKRELEQE